MAVAEQSIASLLLPMNGFHLVLPQSTITEIIARPEVAPVGGAPGWMRGIFVWRAEQVPLISFEEICGLQTAETREDSRIAVLYALEKMSGLVFYALEMVSIPRPLSLTLESMIEREGDDDCQVIARHVFANDLSAVIPDLPCIENMIREQLQKI